MSLLGKIFDAFNESNSTHAHGSSGDKHVLIRCAACSSGDLFRENMETITCNSCGRRYSLDEARKAMGTVNCRDCIYHSINLYDGGITEHCVIWGLDECRSICDRKATKPPHRWTDANRWDRD